MTTDRTTDSNIKYSVFDAIQAGFDKIIIVLSKENETAFKMNIRSKIEKLCYERNVEVCYVRQELKNLPSRYSNGEHVNLGTGQAILAAKEEIDSQFVVINADTFYGDEAFEKIIVKTVDGCEADGVPLDTEAYVSMNMWGFPKSFLRVLEDKFSTRFYKEIPENLLNPEFLLSSIIGNLIREDLCTLTVVETA